MCTVGLSDLLETKAAGNTETKPYSKCATIPKLVAKRGYKEFMIILCGFIKTTVSYSVKCRQGKNRDLNLNTEHQAKQIQFILLIIKMWTAYS